jgi:hypothetical protein
MDIPMAKNSQRCKKMLQGGREEEEAGSRKWKLKNR